MIAITSSRIKALREARKLTMQELADKVGISKSMISYYENGKKTPSVKTINIIASVLNVSVDYLLGKTDSFDGNENTSNDIKLLIEKYERLDPSKKEAILKILDTLAE
ncbi:helix-turn-helix domain-containing protein [Bacillus sp. JJ722]|uniref:helix-turn-helix domain-containing protein n=1 Tax=Bacillus sp. JJ722 TaxID=3122973 RepID=UPI0030002A2E